MSAFLDLSHKKTDLNLKDLSAGNESIFYSSSIVHTCHLLFTYSSQTISTVGTPFGLINIIVEPVY